MTKIIPNKPTLIYLYGFPGSGKSYLARNLADAVQLAYVGADRIRNELFQHPRYDTQENSIISHLMNYITEEFLSAGVSVVYDSNAIRGLQRRKLRDMARKHKSEHLLVWLQIDSESAFNRTQKRDRRTNDDKFSQPQTRLSFDKQLSGMQNPKNEEYLVISGKHAFVTQKGAIINRLYQMGILSSDTVRGNITKPGLINLVPNMSGGRVDMSRRNIQIS